MPTIDEGACLHVDTAGSMAGYFPPSVGDMIVEVLTPYDWQIVIVSDRYTAPVDLADAAVIAVDAYHDIEGFEVPHTAFFGGPAYHVQAYYRDSQESLLTGILRLEQDGYAVNWVFEPAE